MMEKVNINEKSKAIGNIKEECVLKSTTMVKKAAASIAAALKDKDSSFLILTGAGMSVKSGVPIFRSNRQMSPVFQTFLKNYNKAQKKHGLEEAADWFSFSVPEMFKKETQKEAWEYWGWRVQTAYAASPADDYKNLMKIVELFGQDRCFVVTSNCDSMHARAGMDNKKVLEIHGSLSHVQCAKPCTEKTWPVAVITDDLEINKVPMCAECKVSCLRPQVMIFGDDTLISKRIDEQEERLEKFLDSHPEEKMIVIEIGAGTVVPSIRNKGNSFVHKTTVIRVNPGVQECTDVWGSMMMMLGIKIEVPESYCAIQAKSDEALAALVKELGISY